MAKVLKTMRWDEELIDLVEERTDGKDFTDKVHNALYYYFKEEENLKKRIKNLEKRERELKESIKGLEDIRKVSKNMFLYVGEMLDAIGRGNSYQIDHTMKDLNELVESIKKAL